LAGINDGGMIRNCHFKGIVVGFFGSEAGGLVGINSGSIEGSSFEGQVRGAGNSGFVLRNSGQISQSSAKGDFTGQPITGFVYINTGEIFQSFVDTELNGSTGSGGFAIYNEGTIQSSYIKGYLKGNRNFGGFVLKNYGLIRDVYVQADQEIFVEDVPDVEFIFGGLFGENHIDGMIQQTFISGEVKLEGSTNILWARGGVGASNSGAVEGAFWDAESTGLETGIDNGDAGGATGLTTAQMTGPAAQENMPGFDFETVWATTPEGYPVLRWQVEE
jgi:hypothetical protein